MGVKIVSNCCGCASGAYPCLGHTCPRLREEVTYCDICGDEVEIGYYIEVDDKDVCLSCYSCEYIKEDF